MRREATAVIAKAASALLYDCAVWYLVWVCGRVDVCFVVNVRCDGFKNQVQDFSD